MPARASEYADLCEEFLGVPPTIDCGAGVPIPILVDGEEVFDSPRSCDNPDFKGTCPVGSRVGAREGVSADGTPMPEVVWAFFCRSQGPESLELGIVSVQMVGYHKETGATCFFESADAVGSDAHAQYLSFGEDGYLQGVMPGPDEEGFDEAFVTSSDCGECHHSDPFIHTPFIDAARSVEDPSTTELPMVAGPDSPYWVVGGPNWDLRTVHIEGNECTSCHRAPDSQRILQYSGLDLNSFMPPEDPGSMTDQHAAIQDCYIRGPDQVDGCDWVDPPGAYCEAYEGGIGGGPSGGGGGGGGGSSEDCPEDFDPSEPCSPGDKCLLDGTWYICDDEGSWYAY